MRHTRIACVGDSITQGIGDVNLSYPARLQAQLGVHAVVRNFGAMHTTAGRLCPARARDCRSFWASDALRRATDANASHVIFLFGTNDARYTKMEKFVSDYTDLIRLFRRATILIGVPPPLRWANPDLVGPQTRSATIAEKALPDLLSTVASNVGAVPPIDLRAPWYERCARTAGSCRLLQKDGLHPNDAGNELIAHTFARALRHHALRGSKRVASS